MTEYKVGYGKPPKSSRFKSGSSGNAKGRPKGSKNLKTSDPASHDVDRLYSGRLAKQAG